MATSYQVTIGDRTLRVVLRRAGDALLARVDDGDEVAVRLEHVRGSLRAFVMGNQRYEVLAHGGEVSLNGIGYSAEVQDEAHARLAQMTRARGGGHARRELKAPMPGLVVKVLAEAGQTVEARQPLVVLQAMKMENELFLARPGVVKSVAVNVGQTVEAGQVLVVLEE
jgi:biotin carboxyl carrier protein